MSLNIWLTSELTLFEDYLYDSSIRSPKLKGEFYKTAPHFRSLFQGWAYGMYNRLAINWILIHAHT